MVEPIQSWRFLKPEAFGVAEFDAIPLHQLFRILHDVHQGVEAGGWKAELA